MEVEILYKGNGQYKMNLEGMKYNNTVRMYFTFDEILQFYEQLKKYKLDVEDTERLNE